MAADVVAAGGVREGGDIGTGSRVDAACDARVLFASGENTCGTMSGSLVRPMTRAKGIRHGSGCPASSSSGDEARRRLEDT